MNTTLSLLPVPVSFTGNTGQKNYPVINKEFYPSAPDEYRQPLQWQSLLNYPNNIHPRHIKLKTGYNLHTELKETKSRLNITTIKEDDKEVEINNRFIRFVQQVAIRLSDVEMSVLNKDVHQLEFATLILKDLFLDMKLPVVYQLAGQLENLAKENKLSEAKDTLFAIKKLIAKIIQDTPQSKDR